MCSLLKSWFESKGNPSNDLELRDKECSTSEKIAVCVRDASKQYDSRNKQVVVLDGFNMTVPKGTIYGLLGASGCGKTTLLSCILSQKKLNSGKIWILGGAPGSKSSGVPGPRVGYMPQELALYGDFTTQEIFKYFGWIAGMNNKQIQERSKMLIELFMLPLTDQRINTLSGGEQRRVSLASVLLHEPELLILDEPTVGLDPILRENIWQYLKQICEKEKTTIIMTTHYIEETRQADIVGLMRGGKLLAEESPERLLTEHKTQTLEDVFYKLSMSQASSNEQSNIMVSTSSSNESEIKPSTSSSCDANIFASSENEATTFSYYLPAIKRYHMKALIWKNMMWWMRNIPGLAFMLVLAATTIMMFCVSIGSDPHDLPIAIVNYESNYSGNCKDILTCESTQLGCNYFQYLKKHSLVLIDYNSEEDARQSVLHRETYASVIIKNNYSEALRTRIDDWKNSQPWNIESANIDVFRDVSNKYIANYLKIRMYDAFLNFMEDYLETCGISKEALKAPIKWEHPVYGVKYPTFTDFAVPGALLTMSFLLAVVLTSATMLIERNEASFERTFVTGITETELLVAHIGSDCFIMVAQVLLEITCAFSFFDITQNGSLTLVVFLTILTGLCGMCYGILVSCIYDTFTEVNLLVTATFLPTVLLSGVIWPIEGIPKFIQPLTSIFPLTKPTESIRSILQKNWGLYTEVVYMGFISISIWAIFIFIISVIFLKSKRG